MEFEEALQREIRRVKARLESLLRLATVTKRRSHPVARRRMASRRMRRKLSPKVRAQRRLQGQYMGHVRRLTAAQKKAVAAVREKSGYPAAIAHARRLGAQKG